MAPRPLRGWRDGDDRDALPGGDHIDLDIDDPRTVERKPV
jgi:hypothetical protein